MAASYQGVTRGDGLPAEHWIVVAVADGSTHEVAAVVGERLQSCAGRGGEIAAREGAVVPGCRRLAGGDEVNDAGAPGFKTGGARGRRPRLRRKRGGGRGRRRAGPRPVSERLPWRAGLRSAAQAANMRRPSSSRRLEALRSVFAGHAKAAFAVPRSFTDPASWRGSRFLRGSVPFRVWKTRGRPRAISRTPRCVPVRSWPRRLRRRADPSHGGRAVRSFSGGSIQCGTSSVPP